MKMFSLKKFIWLRGWSQSWFNCSFMNCFKQKNVIVHSQSSKILTFPLHFIQQNPNSPPSSVDRTEENCFQEKFCETISHFLNFSESWKKKLQKTKFQLSSSSSTALSTAISCVKKDYSLESNYCDHKFPPSICLMCCFIAFILLSPSFLLFRQLFGPDMHVECCRFIFSLLASSFQFVARTFGDASTFLLSADEWWGTSRRAFKLLRRGSISIFFFLFFLLALPLQPQSSSKSSD